MSIKIYDKAKIFGKTKVVTEAQVNPTYDQNAPWGTDATKSLFINYFYAPTSGTYSFTMTPNPKISPFAIDDEAFVSFDNDAFAQVGLGGGSAPFTIFLDQGVHKVIILSNQIMPWGSSLAFMPTSGQFYVPDNLLSFIGSTYQNISTPSTTAGLATGVQGMLWYTSTPWSSPSLSDVVLAPTGLFSPAPAINFDAGYDTGDNTWPKWASL